MKLPQERKSSLPLDSLPLFVRLKFPCLSRMLCAFYPPANSKITQRTDQSQSKAMSTFESVEFLRSYVKLFAANFLKATTFSHQLNSRYNGPVQLFKETFSCRRLQRVAGMDMEFDQLFQGLMLYLENHRNIFYGQNSLTKFVWYHFHMTYL